jgi:hypothetical protein
MPRPKISERVNSFIYYYTTVIMTKHIEIEKDKKVVGIKFDRNLNVANHILKQTNGGCGFLG